MEDILITSQPDSLVVVAVNKITGDEVKVEYGPYKQIKSLDKAIGKALILMDEKNEFRCKNRKNIR